MSAKDASEARAAISGTPAIDIVPVTHSVAERNAQSGDSTTSPFAARRTPATNPIVE